MAQNQPAYKLEVIGLMQDCATVKIVGNPRPPFDIKYEIIVTFMRVFKDGDLEVGDILDGFRGEHAYAVLADMEASEGIVTTADTNIAHVRIDDSVPMNIPIKLIEGCNGRVKVHDQLQLFKIRGKFRKVILKQVANRRPEDPAHSVQPVVISALRPPVVQPPPIQNVVPVLPEHNKFQSNSIQPVVISALRSPVVQPPPIQNVVPVLPVHNKFQSPPVQPAVIPPFRSPVVQPPPIQNVVPVLPVQPVVIPAPNIGINGSIASYRSDLVDISTYFPECLPYSSTILFLHQDYESYTSSKPDGNSLYRVIAIQYLEHLLRSITDQSIFESYLKSLEVSRDPLKFPLEKSYRSYYISNLLDLRQQKVTARRTCMKFLSNLLDDQKFDAAMVAEFRQAIGYYYYNNHSDASLPKEHNDSNISFQNILKMGEEGTRLTIACAAKAYGVFIKVISLNQNKYEKFEPNVDEGLLMNILMRGQGYDVLYTGDHNAVDNFNTTTKRFNEFPNMACYSRNKLFDSKSGHIIAHLSAEIHVGLNPPNHAVILPHNLSHPELRNSVPSPPIQVLPNLEIRSSVSITANPAPSNVDMRHSVSIPANSAPLNQPSNVLPPIVRDNTVICIKCKKSVLSSELFTDKVCNCPVCIQCYYTLRESTIECINCQLPLSNLECKNCKQFIYQEDIANLKCPNGIACKHCISTHLSSCYFCLKYYKKSAMKMFKNLLKDDENPLVIQNKTCDCCNRPQTLNFGCTHNICNECLLNYLKFQIDANIYSSYGLRCLLCDFIIKPSKFLHILPTSYQDKFNKSYMKRPKRSVICPGCKTKFKAHEPVQCCPNCSTAICMRCLKGFHENECEVDTDFFNIYHKYSQCPNCSKLNGKINLESCRKICKNPTCGTVYCIDCGAPYGPIAIHGDKYHKLGCENRRENELKVQCDMVNCYSCRQAGRLCSQPN